MTPRGWPPSTGRARTPRRPGWTAWAMRHTSGRTCSAGEAGLISTAADYHRFMQMLLNRADSPAGELHGIRLLSPRTVGYMGRNHIPGDLDLETFGRPLYAEFPFRGVGFGLGFA